MNRSFNYTAYDRASGLHIQAKIYDMSASPSLVSTVAMTFLVNGTYYVSSALDPYKPYLANMIVYTDGTFTTPNDNYSPASWYLDASPPPGDIWDVVLASHLATGSTGAALEAAAAGSGGGSSGGASCAVVGYVDESEELVGLVNCQDS